MRYFELHTVQQIVPNTGEEMGGLLSEAAMAYETRMRGSALGVGSWGTIAAQLFYLAADAFEAGASASIGHNRADRYQDKASQLRKHGDNLYGAGRQERSDQESAKLLAAFDDGYAGRDIKRHIFDAREAAIIGQHFAKEGRPMPSRINAHYQPRPLNRDSERDHLLVDDAKFVVDYPGGRVDPATWTITELD